MLGKMARGFASAAGLLVCFAVGASPTTGLNHNQPTEPKRAATAATASQSSEGATYTLRGVVVNSATGEAIHGALVQVYAERQRSVLTGADGKFQFEGLPAGSFMVTCRKPGFFGTGEDFGQGQQQQNAQVGPDTGTITLKLVPEGIIHGRISGDDSQPIERLPIHLLVRAMADGEMQWRQVNGTQTDEEGEFRIAELRPGTYYLFMGPGQGLAAQPSRGTQAGAKGYPAVFYPAAADLSTAAPIQISAGTHAEIATSLAPAPFFRASGTVGGCSQGQSVRVGIQFLDAMGQPAGTNWRFDQGTCEFRTGWMPAGSYIIKAFANDPASHQTYNDSRTLNLNSNVSGIHLSLVPGITIPVSLKLEKTKSENEGSGGIVVTSGSPGNLGRQPSVANVILKEKMEKVPVFRGYQQFGAEEVGSPENPATAFRSVPPGTYEMEVYPMGQYYVESARSGSLDLLRQDLTVAPGAAVEPIDIILRDDAAHVEGTVSYGEHQEQTIILAIPDGARRQTQRAGTNHPEGKFEFPILAPGSYTLLAVDRPDELEYRNPAVLQKYMSKAREVTVGPNQSASVELELVHIRE